MTLQDLQAPPGDDRRRAKIIWWIIGGVAMLIAIILFARHRAATATPPTGGRFGNAPLADKSGVVAYSSVITVQTTRLADEISLLSVQSQALVSSVDLISQLGGGWDASQLERKDRGVPAK